MNTANANAASNNAAEAVEATVKNAAEAVGQAAKNFQDTAKDFAALNEKTYLGGRYTKKQLVTAGKKGALYGGIGALVGAAAYFGYKHLKGKTVVAIMTTGEAEAVVTTATEEAAAPAA